MKTSLKFFQYLFLGFLAISLTFVSCSDDEPEPTPPPAPMVSFEALTALIEEAKGLLNGATEGFSRDQYQFGAIDQLQEVIDNSQTVVDSNTDDMRLVDNALTQLQNAINAFKDKQVISVATPWIQQIPNNRLLITDSDAGNQGAGTLVEGEWQHVAYVHSGSDRILYVNGQEVARGAFPYKSITDNPAVTGVSIGNSFDWTDRVSNALVEDVRVWSIALNGDQLNDQSIRATGDGLEAWFPLKSDGGDVVVDVSGNFQAELTEFVSWAPDGDINLVEKDFSEVMTAIMDAKDFLATVTEGMEVGNYGIGTVKFVQDAIDVAMDIVDNNGAQSAAAVAADNIYNAIDRVSGNVIEEAGPSSGLLYDLDAQGVVGFRLIRTDGTNPALPEGSYTIELEANMNDFLHPNGTETSLLGTGALQFRTMVSTDAGMNGNEGAIEFYVEGAGWTCACSAAGTMIAGEWVKLAAVYDADSNTSKIYLNGVEVASGDNGAYTRRDNNGWMDMWLGNRAGDGNRLDGSARNLRIWSVAKAAADVNADINGDEEGLEMYFPLNMKNAPFFVDQTGNFYGQRIGVTYLD